MRDDDAYKYLCVNGEKSKKKTEQRGNKQQENERVKLKDEIIERCDEQSSAVYNHVVKLHYHYYYYYYDLSSELLYK